jgi:polyisoprenoid-binding protein YceI
MLKSFAAVTTGLALIALTPLAVQAAETDPAKAPAGTYKQDPVHTSLTAKISHAGGLSNYTFRFDKVDITYVYDPANPAATSITAVVDPRSISTGYEKHRTDKDFNAEIYGEERFLNAGKFPTITFKSTSITYQGATGKVVGDLTFMGQTKPITLDVVYNGTAQQGGRDKMGFSATGVMKRSDWGFTSMVGPLGDNVQFAIETEMVKQP